MSTRFARSAGSSERHTTAALPSIFDLQDAPPSGPATWRTLPSGRSVVIFRPRGFDSASSEMAGSGGLFRVLRARRGNSGEHEYAKDTAARPLKLTEEDARALVGLLNGQLREARDRAEARRSTRSRRSA